MTVMSERQHCMPSNSAPFCYVRHAIIQRQQQQLQKTDKKCKAAIKTHLQRETDQINKPTEAWRASIKAAFLFRSTPRARQGLLHRKITKKLSEVPLLHHQRFAEHFVRRGALAPLCCWLGPHPIHRRSHCYLGPTFCSDPSCQSEMTKAKTESEQRRRKIFHLLSSWSLPSWS